VIISGSGPQKKIDSCFEMDERVAIDSGVAYHDILPLDPAHRFVPCNPKLPLHISLAKLLRQKRDHCPDLNRQKILAVSEFFKLNDSEKTKLEELSLSNTVIWDQMSEALLQQEITPGKEPIEIRLVISDSNDQTLQSSGSFHTTNTDRIASNSLRLSSDLRQSRLKAECPLSVVETLKWRRPYPRFSEALSVEFKRSELIDEEDQAKKKVICLVSTIF
jgi:hypothetical protein